MLTMPRTILVFFVFISCISMGQKYPNFREMLKPIVFMDFAIGTSSINGYSLYGDFQVNWNQHNWTVNGFFNSQYRNNEYQPTSGGSGYTISLPDLYYNDHFSHLGLYYGRSFSYKRFHSTVNLGPAYYNFLDQTLETTIVNWQTQYSVVERRYEGISISFFGDINLFLGRKFAIGILTYFDLNKIKSIIGICGSLKFSFEE